MRPTLPIFDSAELTCESVLADLSEVLSTIESDTYEAKEVIDALVKAKTIIEAHLSE